MKKKKIVIVFGAYGGTGSEVCRYNYVRGAQVVMTGRDSAKLEDLARGYDGANSLAVVADANKTDDVVKVFKLCLKKFRGPDEVWITIGKDGAWERDFPDDPEDKKRALWDKLYPSLLQPVETICPIVEGIFRKQGHGILVHLSSQAAFKDEDELPGNNTYRKQKREAEQKVNEMRARLQGTGATTINLRPAIIKTPGNEGVLNTPEKREKAVQPADLAKWVDENRNNPDLPESQYFHSDVVIS